MRFEWVVLLGCCVVSAWLFFDEEPVLDLTDLGLIQTICVLLAMVSVFWENMGRACVGYWVVRDRQLGLWTLTFFMGLDMYFKLIAIVFFLHSMVPLWVDQADTVSLYAYLLGSYWVITTQLTCILTAALTFVYLTYRTPLWVPVFAVAVGSWGWSLGDVLVSGLTSSADKSAYERVTMLGFTPSACTYETRLGGAEFEWHTTSLQPNTFFFLDLASFMYALLLVISWAALLYSFGMGVLGYVLGGYKFFSYTHRAVIISLIEHGLWGVLGGVLMVVGISWRVGFEHYIVGL